MFQSEMRVDLQKYAKLRQMPSKAPVASTRQQNVSGIVDINLSQIGGIQSRQVLNFSSLV